MLLHRSSAFPQRPWPAIKLGRPLSVHNIRVDPDSAGLVFIVHGTDSRSTDGDPDGVVYTIDFKNIVRGFTITSARPPPHLLLRLLLLLLLDLLLLLLLLLFPLLLLLLLLFLLLLPPLHLRLLLLLLLPNLLLFEPYCAML